MACYPSITGICMFMRIQQIRFSRSGSPAAESASVPDAVRTERKTQGRPLWATLYIH